MDELQYVSQAKGIGGIADAQMARPREAGQIPQELQRQEHAAMQLQETISLLEDRLSAVRLAKPEPSGPDTRGEPEQMLADVALAVSAGTAQITLATRRLQSLLRELEL